MMVVTNCLLVIIGTGDCRPLTIFPPHTINNEKALDVLPNKVARYLSVYRRRGVFDYGCVMSQVYLENIQVMCFRRIHWKVCEQRVIFTKLSNSNLRDNNRISQMLQIDRMHLLRNVYLPKSDIGGMAMV